MMYDSDCSCNKLISLRCNPKLTIIIDQRDYENENYEAKFYCGAVYRFCGGINRIHIIAYYRSAKRRPGSNRSMLRSTLTLMSRNKHSLQACKSGSSSCFLNDGPLLNTRQQNYMRYQT